MKRTSLRVATNDLEAAILSRLIGRVSHVTTRAALACILHDQALRPDQDSSLGYGSTNTSYFRSRGCLSLTDLRHASQQEVEHSLTQFYFLNPQLAECDYPVFFVFTSQIYDHLIHWSEWRNRTIDQGVRIVAPTEAGYPRDIPLSHVDEIIEVEVLERASHARL